MKIVSKTLISNLDFVRTIISVLSTVGLIVSAIITFFIGKQVKEAEFLRYLQQAQRTIQS